MWGIVDQTTAGPEAPGTLGPLPLPLVVPALRNVLSNCGGTGFPLPPAGVGREKWWQSLDSLKINQQTNPSEQEWENPGFGPTAKH